MFGELNYCWTIIWFRYYLISLRGWLDTRYKTLQICIFRYLKYKDLEHPSWIPFRQTPKHDMEKRKSKKHEEISRILHPTYFDHSVRNFVRKTDKMFRQDKLLSYCECLVWFPDKKNLTLLKFSLGLLYLVGEWERVDSHFDSRVGVCPRGLGDGAHPVRMAVLEYLWPLCSDPHCYIYLQKSSPSNSCTQMERIHRSCFKSYRRSGLLRSSRKMHAGFLSDISKLPMNIPPQYYAFGALENTL